MSIARTRQIPAVLTAAVAMFALAGCITVQPEPEPTDDATTTPVPPEEEATVSAIAIDGSALTLRYSDGEDGETIPYSLEPQAAISLISDALGSEPVVTAIEDDFCVTASSQATWGDGLIMTYDGDLPFPADARFLLEVTTESVNGVRLETPGGFAVDDPIAELAASDPSMPVEAIGTSEFQIVYFDVVEGTPDGDGEFSGAYAYDTAQEADNPPGSIDIIEAPVDFRWDC